MHRVQGNRGALVTGDVEAADPALREYELELISLGRLAEILGLDRDEAAALVVSRGLPLRIGPRTTEEALEELRTIEQFEPR